MINLTDNLYAFLGLFGLLMLIVSTTSANSRNAAIPVELVDARTQDRSSKGG